MRVADRTSSSGSKPLSAKSYVQSGSRPCRRDRLSLEADSDAEPSLRGHHEHAGSLCDRRHDLASHAIDSNFVRRRVPHDQRSASLRQRVEDPAQTLTKAASLLLDERRIDSPERLQPAPTPAPGRPESALLHLGAEGRVDCDTTVKTASKPGQEAGERLGSALRA